VLDVAEAARHVTGRPVATLAQPRRPGDPPFLVAARGRAERLLGWQPRHSSLKEIIASAWAWHRAHPLGYGN
jgi:UDP-glucose 4-epimerase